MRKFYFVLTALLLQLLGTGAYAQTSSSLVTLLGDPLIIDAGQISSNASDRDEGKNLGALIDDNPSTFWHSDWHNEVSDPHYLQFELFDPIESGNLVIYVQQREKNDGGGNLKQVRVSASEDGEEWTDLADIEIEKDNGGAELLLDPIPVTKTYNYVRITNTRTSPRYMHIAEIELYNPNDKDLVLGVLNEILYKYDVIYYGGYEELNIGTGFGQHSDSETADKFLAAVGNVLNWMDTPDAPDFPALDDAQQLALDIDSMYSKILDSEVPYRIPADGYYRVIANLPYKKTVDTGEKDENGDPITTTEYVAKAMFCSLENIGMYGDLNTDRANYIWKLEQHADSVDMFNAGMETRFSAIASPVMMSETATGHVTFDYAGNEEGRDIFYIRSSKEKRGSDKYLHQNDHGKGTRRDDAGLSNWYGTFEKGNPYDSDKGTSEWYLEPVDEEEALRLIEAFQPIKNHDLLVAQNSDLRQKVGESIRIAKDAIEEKLITSAEQMTSPFSHNDFGGHDGGNLSDGVLIDGNGDTYWHSVFDQGEVETGSHYIQLSGMEKMTGETKIYVKRRKEGNNQFTEFTLKGSNDPEAADEEWETITVQQMGNVTSGGEFTTPAFDAGDKSYGHVRVYASKNKFWHCAELQIYSYRENPNSQFAALGAIATKLEEIYNNNMAKDDADITVEDFETLQEAYQAFLSAMVDPAELRAAIAKYAGTTEGVLEGAGPGYWSDNTAKETFDKLYAEVTAYDKAALYNAEKNRQYIAALELAARNVMASANGMNEGRWYRISVPTEEMYEEYGWNKGSLEGNDDNSGLALFGNIFTVGEREHYGETSWSFWPLETADMREGSNIYAIDTETADDDLYADGSRFRFIPVESDKLVASDFKDLLACGQLAINMNTTYTYGEDLITSASQLSSNASDRAEGKFIENLVDGNVNTFWHSDWHNDVKEPHHLQVSLDKPVSGAIQVKMTRRQPPVDGGGNVLRMFVTASNDGEAWDNIGYLDFPFSTNGESLVTAPIDLGGSYTKLRFIIVRRSGDDNEYDPFNPTKYIYFHCAEFQVRAVTPAGELTPAAAALKTALAKGTGLMADEITASDYAALAEAYNAYRSEINAGGMLVVPAAKEKAGMAYAIQNKANGLFVHAAATNDENVTLQLTPTLFTHSALGYGENLLHGTNIDGKDCTNLHARKLDHRLVTWSANTAGSNSGLMLTEAEESEGEEFNFIKDIKMGHIYNWCYPVALTNNSEGYAYTVAGRYDTDAEETYLALKEAETIAAGQPALYIYGSTTDWTEDVEGEENERITMEFGMASDLSFEAGSENGLTGTLTGTHVGPATILFTDNTVMCVEDENGADVAANRAYLTLNDVPTVDEDGDYDLSIDITEAAGSATGVKDIVARVSRTGSIYTIDGRLVRRNGTMNDLKKLGRGTYILNGVKVMVK